jgi:GTP cyclohydrolase FolE2
MLLAQATSVSKLIAVSLDKDTACPCSLDNLKRLDSEKEPGP